MPTVRASAKAMALLLALAASGPAWAQGQEGPTLEEKLQEKLKEPFASNAKWVLDYEEALKTAKDEKKIVFAYFTRSYSP
jgi:hypothetical protein